MPILWIYRSLSGIFLPLGLNSSRLLSLASLRLPLLVGLNGFLRKSRVELPLCWSLKLVSWVVLRWHWREFLSWSLEPSFLWNSFEPLNGWTFEGPAELSHIVISSETTFVTAFTKITLLFEKVRCWIIDFHIIGWSNAGTSSIIVYLLFSYHRVLCSTWAFPSINRVFKSSFYKIKFNSVLNHQLELQILNFSLQFRKLDKAKS